MQHKELSSTAEMETGELVELRRWVGQQFELTVAASGVLSGWHDPVIDVPWDGDRGNQAMNLNSLFPDRCSYAGAGELDAALMNTSSSVAPAVVAERVRLAWESDGWEVADIWPEPGAGEIYFRADRPDGASMTFQSNADEMVFWVTTVCSDHFTVAYWERHIGDVPSVYPDVPIQRVPAEQ